MAIPAATRQLVIIRGMFTDTADMNYVGARAAFFERRDYDFWWLTLHALEKYLKAILLFNGQTANKPNHNIEMLLSRVKKLDGRLVPPPFVRPKRAGHEAWMDFHNDDFARWLNINGSSQNRYATYSYVISDVDLARADHLIYWARRHARILQQTFAGGLVVDWVAELAASPSVWRHHDASPLERLADLSSHDSARRAFARFNFAFFPKLRHRSPPGRGSHAHNGTIYNCIQSVRNSAQDSPERIEGRAALRWVLDHIYLPKVEVDFVEQLLADFP